MRGTRGQGCIALQLAGIPRGPGTAALRFLFRAALGAPTPATALLCGGEITLQDFTECMDLLGQTDSTTLTPRASPPRVSSKQSCTTTSKINHPLAQRCIVSPADQLQSWQTSLLNSSHSKYNSSSKAAGTRACNNSQGF